MTQLMLNVCLNRLLLEQHLLFVLLHRFISAGFVCKETSQFC